MHRICDRLGFQMSGLGTTAIRCTENFLLFSRYGYYFCGDNVIYRLIIKNNFKSRENRDYCVHWLAVVPKKAKR